ncbi:hypothetical protein BDW60DRAFT_184694 [Aspergillus nidulans var. acristatus]|jgi:hypothetical protein
MRPSPSLSSLSDLLVSGALDMATALGSDISASLLGRSSGAGGANIVCDRDGRRIAARRKGSECRGSGPSGPARRNSDWKDSKREDSREEVGHAIGNGEGLESEDGGMAAEEE